MSEPEAHSNIEYFSEPPELRRPEQTLEEIKHSISTLMDEYKQQGIELSGHIIHVSHYLPFVCTLAPRKRDGLDSDDEHASGSALETSAPPRPVLTEVEQVGFEKRGDKGEPLSEPAHQRRRRLSTVSTYSTGSAPKWTLTHRRGHTAMNAGIRSLGAQFRQTTVGWPGDLRIGSGTGELIEAGSLTERDKAALEEELRTQKEMQEDDMRWAPVWLEDKVAHGHYEGYCKTTLWPLFHYLLWQEVFPEIESDDATYQAYLEANIAYARKVAEIWKPGDLVLVHDYHLLLVPKLLRAIISEVYVGLFLHSPFPSSEIFRCLPRRREILEGMLGSNLVCFQTYSYSRHFLSSCIRVCGFESSPTGVEANGFNTAISHCAIGVDAKRVEADRDQAGVVPKIEALRKLYAGKKIIVGRDKLDPVKGVVQKLQAFHKLLADFPEWRNNVVLIQVTSPALYEDPKLEGKVSDLVSHINSEFGSLGFTPVHHYHQTIDKDEYYALLSVADLGLITATRDGMNTTSLEYILCQSKTYKSPLILSEFTGIAGILNETVRVNPWDIAGTARTIDKALRMSDAEKEERQAALYKRVTAHTAHTWAYTIVKDLLRNLGVGQTARATPLLDIELMKEKYAAAKKRLLLFDYDGTLTPIVKVPAHAVPGNRLKEILPILAADPKNIVYIVSGRDGAFLEEHLGHIEALGLSAEHGCFIREPHSTSWWNLTEQLDMSWMEDAHDIFRYYTERTTGSQIERKKASVTWHYRNCDADFGSFQAKQCHDLLESNLVPKKPIEVLVGKKNLEVRPLAVNKGEIVKRILFKHPDASFVFCAGDDKTDEDMFRSLSALFVASPTSPVPGGASGHASGPTLAPPLGFEGSDTAEPAHLELHHDAVFATTVGPSNKRTLAGWHVTSSDEVVEAVAALVE